MDLRDDTDERSFRTAVRAWLDQHLPPADQRATPMASGPGALAAMKAWQRTIYDGGWAGITVPRELGGRGGTIWQQNIWNEETTQAGLSPGMLAVGLGMVVPTLMAWGTTDQKERFIAPTLQGEVMWCQLFSEPEAGSDLASLRTRATRDDDGWVINGQKVWTSEAQHADHAILLARTDPDAPKHKGITYFLVDMRSPGLDIRPIVDISGECHFNEVFITDLHLPRDAVVGEVDRGWTVANSTLAAERGVMGGGQWGIGFPDLRAIAERSGLTGDSITRQRLARAYERGMVLELLRLRARSAADQGVASSAASLLKLANGAYLGTIVDLAVDFLGSAGLLTGDDATESTDWARLVVRSFSLRFAGGTSEIQRNVLAERVLGLPRDPRPF